jgi:AcrR family transcriptional regulator
MIELMSSVHARRTKASVVTEFRRTQILQAARESFARYGLANATMSQIAKRARVAKGTIYLHYRSKEAILRDAVRDGITDLRAATVPQISEAGTLDAAVRRFFEATLGFFDASRDFFYLCHAELEPRLRDEIRNEIRAVYAAQIDAWQTRLAASKPRRGALRLTAAEAARMIVSLAFGLSAQRVRGWTDHASADDAAAATAMILKGLES